MRARLPLIFAGLLLGAQPSRSEVGDFAQAQAFPPPNRAQDLGQPQLNTPAPTIAREEKPEKDEEDVDLLQEFSITAARRRELERATTQETYVVDEAEIAALGATTVAEALRLVPGLAGLSGGGGGPRGLGSQRIIFLVDGAPQPRGSNGGNIPTTNVARVDVTLGGGSLRYSAEAAAGVINVITRSPEGPPKLFARINLGNLGFSQYSLNYTGSNGQDAQKAGFWAYDLTYQRQNSINQYPYTVSQDPFGVGVCDADLPGPCFVNGVAQPGKFLPGGFNVTSQRQGAYNFSDTYLAKVIFKPGNDHRITFSVQQQNRKSGSATNRLGCALLPANRLLSDGSPNTTPAYALCTGSTPSLDPRVLGYGDNDDTSTSYNAVWDWELSKLSSLQTQLSYRSAFISTANPSLQRYTNTTNLDGSIRYNSQLTPNNTLNLGLEFREQRLTQAQALPATANGAFYLDRAIANWALYATEDLKFFNGAFLVNLGARLTNNVTYGNFTVTGVGLRYNFGPGGPQAPLSLRANWQQTFRVPSITDLYNGGLINAATPNPGSSPTFAAGNQQFLSNPNLRPETGTTYDFGFDLQLSSAATFRATYYRTDVQSDIYDGSVNIGIRPVPGFPGAFADTFQAINAQSLLSTGWELSFNWEIDRMWSFNANQTFVDSRPLGSVAADLAVLNGGYFYEYGAPDVAFNATNLRLAYRTGSLNVNLSGQLFGPRPREYGFLNPGYSRWDLTVRIPVNAGLTFTTGVFNIFNDQQPISSRPRFSSGSTVSVSGLTNPGTTFRVGAEVTF